jgi:hypothetical protein
MSMMPTSRLASPKRCATGLLRYRPNQDDNMRVTRGITR